MRMLDLAVGAPIAVTTTPVYQARAVPPDMTLAATFVFGSGSASIDAWVQTTVDGLNFLDVANFHFAGASGSGIFNLTAETPITTAITPGDGVLAAKTAIDGIVGSKWRIKFSSSGTYGGNTHLAIDAFCGRPPVPL